MATDTRDHSTVSEAHPSTIINQTFAVARLMARVRAALGVAIVTVAGFTHHLETAALAMDLPRMTPKIMEATEGLRSLPGTAVMCMNGRPFLLFSGPNQPPNPPSRTLLDDKMRYKQLLYLAQQCPDLDGVHKTAENKVPGVFGVEAVAGSLCPRGARPSPTRRADLYDSPTDPLTHMHMHTRARLLIHGARHSGVPRRPHFFPG